MKTLVFKLHLKCTDMYKYKLSNNIREIITDVTKRISSHPSLEDLEDMKKHFLVFFVSFLSAAEPFWVLFNGAHYNPKHNRWCHQCKKWHSMTLNGFGQVPSLFFCHLYYQPNQPEEAVPPASTSWVCRSPTNLLLFISIGSCCKRNVLQNMFLQRLLLTWISIIFVSSSERCHWFSLLSIQSVFIYTYYVLNSRPAGRTNYPPPHQFFLLCKLLCFYD